MKKHIRAQAYPLYLGIVVGSAFGMTTAQTVSGVYLVEIVKLNPMQLILVGTVLEVVCFCLQIPTGALADTYSRRFSVILGYLLLGLGYLVQGFVPRFEVILLAQVLSGAGFSFVMGAEEAWVADEIGEARAGNTFVRATQWGQIGSLVAIPLSIWIANRWPLQVSIIVGACILVGMAILLIGLMPEHNFRPAARDERTTWGRLSRQAMEGGRVVFSSKMLLCALGVTLFAGLASEGFDRLDTAHFLLDFTLPSLWGLKSVTWFGIISAGSMLLSIGVAEVVRRRVDTRTSRSVIVALLVLDIVLIGSVLLFGLAGNFYIALAAYWCARVVRTTRAPLHSTWMTQNTDARQRATVFSFDGMVDPIGQIAGGPLVGLIGEWFSLRAALVVVGLIMSPSLIFLGRALGLCRPIRDEEQPAIEVAD